MNGSELRVVLFITRKTYGFQKKSDRISLSQFQLGTGMNRAQAVETIKSLVEKRIVIKDGGVYKLNKNYEEWVVCKRPGTDGVVKSDQPGHCLVCKEDRVREIHHIIPRREGGTGHRENLVSLCPTCHSLADSGKITREDLRLLNLGSMQKHTKSSMQKHTHKRKKETITKEISKTSVLHGDQWNLLIDSFSGVNPMYEDFYRNTTERKALDTLAGKIGFDKLLATIKHLDEITSQPYAPKITKPTELKRDLGKLLTFYKQNQSKLPKSNVYEV